MKVVLQKINYCNLIVDEKLYSSVKSGLLITVGVHRDDTLKDVEYLSHKIANMRLFKDENDKLNLNVLDVKGDCMVVSNFTLQAQIQSGTRPNFSRCAGFELANDLYLKLADALKQVGIEKVEHGKFREHMHLDCEIDGPLTIILNTGKEGE